MARAERTRDAEPLTPALLAAYPVDAHPVDTHPVDAHDVRADNEERGRVLVIGGSGGSAGALRLAAEAALRAGARRLQLATVERAVVALAVAVPEAQVIGLPESRSTGLRVPTARAFATQPENADAVLIGPGMLDTADATKLVGQLSFAPASTLVLDAGALGACVDRESLPETTVITPHAGELRSLAVTLDHAADEEAQAVALGIARRCRVICVAKGATTWIVTSEGQCFCHTSATTRPGMPGSGDVLGGLIAGLAARGGHGLNAALWAVYLHALASERLERQVGRTGCLARDLAREIPALLPS